MLKKIMITTALSTMMIGAAAAQTPPASTTTTPSATPAAPAASSATPAANSAAGEAKFINSQTGDQWLSSNFIGVDVMGPNDEKIGDVADILFDKSGNVIGYVVGVGGFLGIGAKNVALAPTSFEVMPASSSSATTGSASAARSDDVKLKLNMTKDQLNQAAAFESKRDQDSKANRPATGAGGAGGAAPATSPR